MFETIRRWRRERVLRTAALPDALWREAQAALPFLARYTEEERGRLRDMVVLFLDAKGIVGARGHEVTPLQRVVIAIQACVLILNLDPGYYDGWENIVVYPDEFLVRDREIWSVCTFRRYCVGMRWHVDRGIRQDGRLPG